MAEWEEMERRDEEVARALQREEHERAADIERKDEQLAHLIAVQERRQEALRRRRRQEQTNAAADEARRRREADDAEYARTLQEQFDAEKKGDGEVKRMMELMEEEEASMSLIRQLLGHERQFRVHHDAEDLMKHSGTSPVAFPKLTTYDTHATDATTHTHTHTNGTRHNTDVQLCEALFAGDIRAFLTEDTRQVTDIKRVLQLELVRRFMAKWLELKRTYGTPGLSLSLTRSPHVADGRVRVLRGGGTAAAGVPRDSRSEHPQHRQAGSARARIPRRHEPH